MRQLAINFGKRLLPDSFAPRNVLARQVLRRTGGLVHSGPFRGLQYATGAVGSVYTPKLVGTYEKELWHAIEQLASYQPDVFIDIGAAEGYYAVGVPFAIDGVRTVAFEENPDGRALLTQMAAANGLSNRIDVKGRCDFEVLTIELSKARRPAVLCDIEGFEAELIDPDRVPELRRAWILVELHEFVKRGVRDLLLSRLEKSHELKIVDQRQRTRDEYPFSHFYQWIFPDAHVLYPISEFRPEPMSWLLASPNAS